MQRRLIRKRGSCLAVVTVLLFAGLFMTACSLDGIDNGEGQGTLVASLEENPKNVPPVVNKPPKGQPVIDNPSEEAVIEEPPATNNPSETDDPPAEPPATNNPSEEAVIEEPPVAGNPSETDNPPTEPPVTNNPSEVDDPPTEPPVTDNPPTEPPVIDNPSETDDPPTEPPVVDNPPEQPKEPIFISPFQPEELGSYPGLDAETERQVKQAWVNYNGGETEWFSWKVVSFRKRGSLTNRYYGNYNGCVVIAMHQLGISVATGLGYKVGKKVFCYSNQTHLYVWKDGRFYDAQLAYKNGILTDDMVNDMYYEGHKDSHYMFPEYNRLRLVWLAHAPNEKEIEIWTAITNGEIVFPIDPPDHDYFPVDPQDLAEANLYVSPWRDYSIGWPENGWGPGEIRVRK